MRHTLTLLLALVVCFGFGGTVFGADLGTRDEANSLLKRAVAVLKADTNRGLEMFTSGEGGFIKKDLYVWCGGPDGMLTAHPHFMGVALKRWKDNSGKAVGAEIYAAARKEEFSEIAYKAPRPAGASKAVTADDAQQVDKVSIFTKVGDNICGVGYYK